MGAADLNVGSSTGQQDAATKLPSADKPLAVVPMRLPSTREPVEPAAEMETPEPRLPEIKLPAPASVVEPMRFLAAFITRTPSLPLGTATVPFALVPMKLPSITLLDAPTPLSVIPLFALPEITFRRLGRFPPTVFRDD